MPYVKEFEFFFCDKRIYHVKMKRQRRKRKERKNLSVLAVNENGKREEQKFVNNFFLANVNCRFA